MYRIEISSFEKYIDTFRYQQKIKRYDIISIYRPTLASNSRTELEGGVMGLFVLINTTLLAYKQLSGHNNSNNEL